MGINDIVSRIKKLKGLKVRAGVLGATYVDGKSVAEVAMYNEYGTSTSPARPFLRTTLVNKADEWAEGLRKMGVAYLEGRADLETVADKMGVAMQTGILETIDSNMPPPNAESTYKRKLARLKDSNGESIKGGADTIRTLVDSGVMRDSISYDYDIGEGYSLESET